jgi:hypothetical protein
VAVMSKVVLEMTPERASSPNISFQWANSKLVVIMSESDSYLEPYRKKKGLQRSPC